MDVNFVHINLTSLLKEAISISIPLLNNYRDQSKDYLVEKLESLDLALKNAEQRQGQYCNMRILAANMVKNAHDAEDLVETLVLKIEGQNLPISPIQQFIRVDPLNRSKRSMKKKIRELTLKILEIGLEKYSDIYNPNASNPEHIALPYIDNPKASNPEHIALREHRPRNRNDVVGLEPQIGTLVARLIGGDSSPLSKVCITGMGGIGKTTLAQCVYEDGEVKRHFQFRLWISISQNCTLNRVLLDIVTGLIPDAHTCDDVLLAITSLRSLVYGYLEKGRYLIVLDDVWSIDILNSLINTFPKSEKGSKILLTSRNNQVATEIGGYTHQMRFLLGAEESWTLFREVSFRVHGADPELEDIGKGILQQCSQLPLVILGVGKFLSHKKSTKDWQRVSDTMTPLGPNGELDHLFSNLALSFKDLAPKVKHCFLRLCCFPKDHEIPTRKLFHLWIADHQNQGLEGEAHDILRELIDKNLVQQKKTRLDGKVKTCWVHPSIHELLLRIGKKEFFLEIQSTSSFVNTSTRTRHKVILSSADTYFQSETFAPKLRSLLFFLPRDTSTLCMEQIRLKYEQFKLLRVLELEGVPIDDQMSKCGLACLHNLRYLNLRSTGIKSFHKSMHRLKRLMMLDIRGNGVISHLNVIREMTALRYVFLGKEMDRSSESLQFETLTQLRSIGWISPIELRENKLERPNLLQKLKLKFSTQEEAAAAEVAWKALASNWKQTLVSLHLLGVGTALVFPTETLFCCLKIRQLTLRNIRITSDLMSILANLQQLTLLTLKESSTEEGSIKVDASTGFRHLAFLELSKLEDLQKLKVKNVLLPFKLKLSGRNQLNMMKIPDGVEVVKDN